MDLPASIEAAWGLRERPQRGPKPGLSLPRIVEAGVKIAEAEGLAGVSMARVAAEVGAAPMSLYRHVSSKDELVALMVDAIYGTPPEPARTDWRDGLSRWAWALRGVMYAHAWALRVPITGLPARPNEVAWFECALASLDGTGLTEAQKASVILLVSGYVRIEASTGTDVAEAIRASGTSATEWMAAYARLLARLADPQRFPALTAFISSGVFDVADGPDDEFNFGLERILDGIGGLMAARSGPQPDPAK